MVMSIPKCWVVGNDPMTEIAGSGLRPGAPFARSRPAYRTSMVATGVGGSNRSARTLRDTRMVGSFLVAGFAPDHHRHITA